MQRKYSTNPQIMEMMKQRNKYFSDAYQNKIKKHQARLDIINRFKRMEEQTNLQNQYDMLFGSEENIRQQLKRTVRSDRQLESLLDFLKSQRNTIKNKLQLLI